jgi:nicotinamidase/pyrazinamidase
MVVSKLIFWNVDTQFDFVSPQGKLYVPGAELLKPKWERLTNLAKTKSIIVVNTADWHHANSAELSDNPDFVNTFPQHCMANTQGAEFIEETNPEDSYVVDWDKDFRLTEVLKNKEKIRNYTFRKDAFDIFKGNKYAGLFLDFLSPTFVIVYGVTTNVCVNDAVVGLARMGKSVIVVEDAIKELPNIPLPFDNWNKMDVTLMPLSGIENLL